MFVIFSTSGILFNAEPTAEPTSFNPGASALPIPFNPGKIFLATPPITLPTGLNALPTDLAALPTALPIPVTRKKSFVFEASLSANSPILSLIFAKTLSSFSALYISLANVDIALESEEPIEPIALEIDMVVEPITLAISTANKLAAFVILNVLLLFSFLNKISCPLSCDLDSPSFLVESSDSLNTSAV